MESENRLEFSGENIYYRTVGKGPSVILLHGFAEDGTIWNQQVPNLKDLCRLLIPDLPGSGQSPLNRELPLIDDYADAIKAILDKESIKTCILIGHSMGGYISLAFAEKYPDMLLGLGLFHSTAYADSNEKIAARRKSMEFIEKYGSAEFIRQSTPNLFSVDSKASFPEFIEELIGRYRNFNPASLVSYYEAMIKRPDRTAVLRDFQKPVLFIIGEQDNAVPLEHSLQQAHIPGLAYILILHQAGHMGMLEEPAKSNECLGTFIKNAAI